MPNAKMGGILISLDQGVMTYEILHGLCPDNLRNKFVERAMISEHATRNHRDLRNFQS